MKCYPKRGSNQTPYQKIEFEIRKDADFWPPITAPAPTNVNENPAPINKVQSHNVVNEVSNPSELNRTNSSIKKQTHSQVHHSKPGDDNNYFEMSIQSRNSKSRKNSEHIYDQFTKI